MEQIMEDVFFERGDRYAVCHIERLSDDLKLLIRNTLTAICHGELNADGKKAGMYGYQATVKEFVIGYKTKPKTTQIGLIGELLAHLLLVKIFDDLEVASAYFNLEERSIKKGFDLILANKKDRTLWIAEVKSGELQKNLSQDATTSALLTLAYKDLEKRLSSDRIRYWQNAINHVRSAVPHHKDYKTLLETLLEQEGDLAAEGKATCCDNYAVLISNLFDSLDTRITRAPAQKVLKHITKKKLFANTIVLSIQKETYERVASFIESEAGEV